MSLKHAKHLRLVTPEDAAPAQPRRRKRKRSSKLDIRLTEGAMRTGIWDSWVAHLEKEQGKTLDKSEAFDELLIRFAVGHQKPTETQGKTEGVRHPEQAIEDDLAKRILERLGTIEKRLNQLEGVGHLHVPNNPEEKTQKVEKTEKGVGHPKHSERGEFHDRVKKVSDTFCAPAQSLCDENSEKAIVLEDLRCRTPGDGLAGTPPRVRSFSYSISRLIEKTPLPGAPLPGHSSEETENKNFEEKEKEELSSKPPTAPKVTNTQENFQSTTEVDRAEFDPISKLRAAIFGNETEKREALSALPGGIVKRIESLPTLPEPPTRPADASPELVEEPAPVVEPPKSERPPEPKFEPVPVETPEPPAKVVEQKSSFPDTQKFLPPEERPRASSYTDAQVLMHIHETYNAVADELGFIPQHINGCPRWLIRLVAKAMEEEPRVEAWLAAFKASADPSKTSDWVRENLKRLGDWLYWSKHHGMRRIWGVSRGKYRGSEGRPSKNRARVREHHPVLYPDVAAIKPGEVIVGPEAPGNWDSWERFPPTDEEHELISDLGPFATDDELALVCSQVRWPCVQRTVEVVCVNRGLNDEVAFKRRIKALVEKIHVQGGNACQD